MRILLEAILLNRGIAKAIMSRSYQDVVHIDSVEKWEFLKETFSIFMVGAFETTDVSTIRFLKYSVRNLNYLRSFPQEK